MKPSPMLWSMLMVIGGAGLAGLGFVPLLEWVYSTFGARASYAFMTGLFAVTLTVGVVGCLLQGARR